MGAWGWGPTDNDDAADLGGQIAAVLDEAWAPLRAGTVDAFALARACEAAALVRALVDVRLHVMPRDGDELAERWQAQLPADVRAALAMQLPFERPPFAGEGAAERWLREAEAPYQVWMWASAFGDDRIAAWRACRDIETMLVLAKLAGVGEPEIVTALARTFEDLLGEPTEELYLDLAAVLDELARTGTLSDVLLSWLESEDAALREAFSARQTEAYERGEPRLDRDPRELLFDATVELAHRRLDRVRRFVTRLVDTVPELAGWLHARLDPVVVPRLTAP